MTAADFLALRLFRDESLQLLYPDMGVINTDRATNALRCLAISVADRVHVFRRPPSEAFSIQFLGSTDSLAKVVLDLWLGKEEALQLSV